MKNQTLAKFDSVELPVTFVPAKISFEGYDEMKAKVDGLHESLESFDVTADNLKEAKATRAKLNKFKKAMNDEKIRVSRQADEPVKQFKDKVKSLMNIVDDSSDRISKGIKVYEEKAREERRKKNLEHIKSMCELANVDPNKIEYDASWDNKSYSKTRFENDVDSQIALIQQREKQLNEAIQTVSQKADKLALPSEQWINQLKYKSLPDVLNAMDQYKAELTEIAKRQHDTKVQEVKDLKKHGDHYVDAKTGEVKDKIYTVRLAVRGNAWQMKQLQSFLRDNAIEFRSLEG